MSGTSLVTVGVGVGPGVLVNVGVGVGDVVGVGVGPGVIENGVSVLMQASPMSPAKLAVKFGISTVLPFSTACFLSLMM